MESEKCHLRNTVNGNLLEIHRMVETVKKNPWDGRNAHTDRGRKYQAEEGDCEVRQRSCKAGGAARKTQEAVGKA